MVEIEDAMVVVVVDTELVIAKEPRLDTDPTLDVLVGNDVTLPALDDSAAVFTNHNVSLRKASSRKSSAHPFILCGSSPQQPTNGGLISLHTQGSVDGQSS